MRVRLPAIAFLVSALALEGTACHERSSSSPPVPGPSTSTSNLGLAFDSILGSGDLRLVVVPEGGQGRDLDGDGDLLDGGFVGGVAYGVVHVVDLRRDSLINTGLVLGVTRPHSIEVLPEPVAAVGTVLAFGVDEHETGGLDRNGDGDAEDFVLALYERDSGSVTNLGLAVSHVAAAEPILAFDVPEAAQGEDLDGDGDVGFASVPFVHDLRTGETWNTGLRGRRVLGVQGAGVLTVEANFVALAASESVLGDRNGDGDSSDLVFEVYDVTLRTVQPAGLALLRGIGGLFTPVVHHGRWAFTLGERDQGSDLDGDGDSLDLVSVLYDPESATTRFLGSLLVGFAGFEPLVLFEQEPEPSGYPTVWLYDRDTDLLVSSALRGVDVARVGQRIAIDVPEDVQREDLDRNGAFESFVPVLFDFRSARRENLGIDSIALQPSENGLLLRSRENASRVDWNGDGDREDVVLFTWDELRGLVNTRLAPESATWLDEEIALVSLSEADRHADLNGDGDDQDYVLHAYDVSTRRLTNLGLAAGLPFQGGGGKVLLAVRESQQGQDLNGDGDQADGVLHLVEVGP